MATTGARAPEAIAKPEDAIVRPQDCTCQEKFRENVGLSRRHQDELENHVLFANVLRRKRNAMWAFNFFRYSLHVILILQIVFGAVIATLGSVKAPAANNTVVALGAVQAVLAGLISLMKAANQPKRAHILRAQFRELRDDLIFEVRTIGEGLDPKLPHDCQKIASDEARRFQEKFQRVKSFTIDEEVGKPSYADRVRQQRERIAERLGGQEGVLLRSP
jgi:hypothetical protein